MGEREGRLLLGTLLTGEEIAQLRRNGREDDPIPVALLRAYNGWAWLLAAQDPEYPDKVLGIADLGIEQPELGYISLARLADIEMRMPIERDKKVKLDQPLSLYMSGASKDGKL